MISVRMFSHLVSLVFAAAVSAGSWDVAIGEISDAFDDPHGRAGRVHGTKLMFAEGDARMVIGTPSPIADVSYREYYGRLDHVMQAVESGPVGVVRSGTELIAPQTGNEFYADWIKPNDLEGGLFVRLTEHPMPTTFAVAGSNAAEPFDSAERMMLMDELVPHLRQALSAQRRLSVLSNRSSDLADALDLLPHGIVVVDVDLRILECNSAAEYVLTHGQALRMSEGCLAAWARDTQRQLQRLVFGAVAGDGSGVKTGGALTCARPAPRRPYVVHVLPIDRRAIGVVARAPVALVLVIDPERDVLPAAPLLRQLYGFTNTEAAVARLLVHGYAIPAVGDQLSLSVATVKTHLRAIFAKTGAHRQAELVALLLSANP